MPAPSALADLLRHFRKVSGMTQEALAEQAGLSNQAIGALEGGRRRYPRPDTLKRLAAALELGPEDHRKLTEAARRPGTGEATKDSVPRQLPPPVDHFVGRSGHLSDLTQLLTAPLAQAPSIVVTAIGGMGGVGKSALGLTAAHHAVEHFPDGQLHLDLQATGDAPLSAAQALDVLLSALGIAPAAPGDDLQVTAARYRTAMAGRRILLFLDDAASVEQVMPLMPGTPGAAVVITSRQQLTGLPGVRHLVLDVLNDDEATALLTEIVGADRVSAAPEAAAEIVRRCARSPLAIHLVGGLAKTASLTALAASLADDEGRHEILTGAGTEVSRCIRLSLAALEHEGSRTDLAAVRAFPALASFDGFRFPLRVAAHVLQISVDDAEDLLERLVDVHLLETPSAHHYRMHDLVRDVGRALAQQELTAESRSAARRRELDCYRSILWRWSELTGSPEEYGSRTGISWSGGAEDLYDVSDTLRWLEAELPNLNRLVRTAAAGDAEDRLSAVQLALGMPRLAANLQRFADAFAALNAVSTIDVELPASMQIGRLYQAGHVTGSLGLSEQAVDLLKQALPIARRLGTPKDVAVCLIDLGQGLANLGQLTEALACADEGLAIVHSEGLERFEVGGSIVLGGVAGLLGDLDRQHELNSHAVALMPERTAPGTRAVFLTVIGEFLRKSGQHDEAIAILRQAAERAKELGAEVIEADALQELGSSLLETGDLAAAEASLRAGVEIAIRHPLEHREAPLLQVLGKVCAASGGKESALIAWNRALMLYERQADPRADELRTLLGRKSNHQLSEQKSGFTR
ncbi:tetratricopeptide repeat protein [Kribbella sp. NPDC051770]|uniref:tetratricopeptide repeat protein n=1 Tax=Kribbella sp. NPDC051770 TaxID=3155413 RepID=UPI00342CFD1B